MSRFVVGAALAAVAVACLVSAAGPAAATAGVTAVDRRTEANRRARSLVADGDFQKVLVPAVEPPKWGSDGFSSSFVGTVARVILWVGIGALALFVAIWAARSVDGARRRREGQPTVARLAESGPEGGATLTAADALVAQGDFASAARELLLVAAETLAMTRGAPLPPAATGRELVRLLAEDGAQRERLRLLVRTVELAVFADVPPDRAALERCRTACEELIR